MVTITNLVSLLGCICLSIGYSPYVPASKLAPQCFECNYSPRGEGGYKWQALSRAGYPSCALRHPADMDKVDKYKCASGVCFIRHENNGLIYRGCADPHVLPWGVTPAHQCKKQGPSKALWWFCLGDLCNFVENPCAGTPGAMTSYKDAMMTNATTGTTTATTTTTAAPPTTEAITKATTALVPTAFKDFGSSGSSMGTKSRPYEKTTPPSPHSAPGAPGPDYNMYHVFPKIFPVYPFGYYEYDYKYDSDMPEVPENSTSEEESEVVVEVAEKDVQEVEVEEKIPDYQQEEEGEEQDYQKGDKEEQEIIVDESEETQDFDPYNPCDGECKDNPSGLFPHPDKMNYFIQCGFDSANGHSCSCCKPFYRRCPPGTEFDDSTKVCTQSSNLHGKHKQVVVEEDVY